MKKNSALSSNPYSRYKYSNDGTLKYTVDPYTYKVTTFGAELKAHKDNFKLQLDDMDSHLNLGNTWVINNIYPCTQVSNVDRPINPIKKGSTFFRLFRLK